MPKAAGMVSVTVSCFIVFVVGAAVTLDAQNTVITLKMRMIRIKTT